MERIMVLGVSSGVGKSSFARKLSKKKNIPVHHLDSYFWKAGWIESGEKEFSEKQQQLVEEDRWIIEGNYTGTYEVRSKKADTLIYLELPLAVCLYRVVKRRVTNQGKTRPDMALGCPEKLDKEFLMFIISTYSARKIKMRKRMVQFIEESPHNKVVFLRNQKQINGYLEKMADLPTTLYKDNSFNC